MINPTVRALIMDRIDCLERDLASANDARDRARDTLTHWVDRVGADERELAALREQLEPEPDTIDVGTMAEPGWTILRAAEDDTFQCPSVIVDEEQTAWRCVAERGHQGHHHSAVWTQTW